jgi:FkbM family methyltransferase
MSQPIIMPGLPPPHLLCRFGTQDITVAHDMLVSNEYRLPALFEDGDIVIDIGAHIGSFAWECVRRGCRAVHCFEPDESNYRVLRMNAERMPGVGRVTVDHCAVGAETGTVRLAKAGFAQTAMPHTMNPDLPGVDVHCLSIATVMGLNVRQPIRMIKLDCEGSEYPILNAATPDMMARVQEIVGEIHYQFHPGITDQWLVATLGHLGFKVSIRNQAPDNRACIAIFTATRRNP